MLGRDLKLCRFLALQADASIAKDIYNVVGEQGEVRDSASDALRRARAACSTIERRLRSALGKTSGYIVMHAGRLCVALPAGTLH